MLSRTTRPFSITQLSNEPPAISTFSKWIYHVDIQKLFFFLTKKKYIFTIYWMPMNSEVLELFQNFDISLRKSNVLMILKVPDLLAFTNVEDGIFLHHQNRKAIKSRNQNIKEQISRLESRKQKLLKIWNCNSKFYLQSYFLFYLLKIQHLFKLEHKYLSCSTHEELKTIGLRSHLVKKLVICCVVETNDMHKALLSIFSFIKYLSISTCFVLSAVCWVVGTDGRHAQNSTINLLFYEMFVNLY